MNFREAKVRYPFLIPVLLISLSAIIIRIIFFVFELKSPLFLYPIIDESEFIHTARIIAANNFYNPEHFWHPPFYSWVLAFFFKIGFELKFIVLFQLFLGVFGSIILYAGLRNLNPKAAFITALIWAVYPVELFTETRFLSENLYIFLSICLLYQLTHFEITLKKLLGVAFVTTLLILTKSQFILFLFFFLGFLIVKEKKVTINALIFFSVAMILPLIVSLNNSRKADGNFMFISSNGPINLYIGNSSDINKTLNIRPYEWQEKFFPELYNEAGIKFTIQDTSKETYYPYKLSGFLKKKTISDNLDPKVPIKNLFFKTFGFLHSEETPRNYDLYLFKQFNALLDISIWKFPFYFPLALIFYAALLYILIRRRFLLKTKPWFWLLVLFLIHLLPSILFFNAFRYRLPAVPILIFFAVLFYSENFKNIKLLVINLLLILIFGTQATSALLIQKIPLYESFNTIGKAYLKQDKPERAGFWFKKAQRNLPEKGLVNNSESLLGSAVAKEKSGDLQGSLTELNQAVEKNSNLAEVYLFRASILYKLSDFTSALEDYSHAVDLNKANKKNLLSALYGRGLSKARLNDNQSAMQDFDSAIALSPTYTEAYTNRGIIKAKLGKFEEAIRDFDSATKLDPNNDKPYFNRAGAFAALGNLKKGIQNLNDALKIKPDYAQAYYMRGKMLLETASEKDACSDFKKALQLGYAPAKQEIDQYCNQ